ncbi:MAG TPA: ABC transporter permease [Candidatus Nanopelagicaceae bacterium]|nr:ABC transporter permease [Candidatus Nanopelagicaceae bacterium]
MNSLEIIRFAVRGLSSNRLRSGLTTLGILIGVASVIILTAVGNGSSLQVQKNIQRLGANSLTVQAGGGGGFGRRAQQGASSAKPLTVADAVALSNKTASPSIKSVSPVAQANATCAYEGSSATPQNFVGTWPSYFEASNDVVSKGSYFTNDDVVQGRHVIILGQTMVTDIYGTVDPINTQIVCGGQPFTVIGVLAVKGTTGFQDADNIAIAPLSTVQQTLTGYGSVDSIVVEAVSAKATDMAQTEIAAVLDERHKITNSSKADYRIFNQASLLQTTSSNSAVFTVLLSSVAAISLLVGGIGITNIMLVSVTERTREIGIRKAIGAPRGAILGQFLTEATMLSLIGGIAGVVVGIFGSHFQIVGVTPVVVPSSVILSFGISVAIGLFFGGYPANRAASLKPIEALRYE